VTPFTFIDFFACKVDPGGRHTRCLIARATQVILAAMHGNVLPRLACVFVRDGAATM
jgi:cyclin D1/2/4